MHRKIIEKINLHIYPTTNFNHETRLQKETKSIANDGLFDRIFIVVLSEKNFREYNKLDAKREIWRVPLLTACLPENTLCKILKHIEWFIKIFLKFRNKPIKCVNCHNLSSLPIGVLFKVFSKSKVIYDTHELETERHGWSRARSAISKIMEKYLINKVDVVITTTDSIAKWYKNKYSLKNVYAIYNFPYQQKKDWAERFNILKKKFHIQNNEILFIYQGVLDKGRSIKHLLNTFADSEDKKQHIVFMGFGPFENMIKKYTKNFSNIHFYPAVKQQDVIKYTRSADVGLCLTENTCLNHYLTLGNKVLEYLSAGLAIISSDFPEPSKIIDSCQCGWTIKPNKQSFVNIIKNISNEDVREKKRNAWRCRNNFVWENEANKLLKIYHNI